jgi:hypothetical protein
MCQRSNSSGVGGFDTKKIIGFMGDPPFSSLVDVVDVKNYTRTINIP